MCIVGIMLNNLVMMKHSLYYINYIECIGVNTITQISKSHKLAKKFCCIVFVATLDRFTSCIHPYGFVE